MLTKTDKKWIKEHFPSRKAYDAEVERTRKEIEKISAKLKKNPSAIDLAASNIGLRTEMAEMEDRLRGEMNSKHDEVMTALDQIMGEVVRGREHDLVVAHQIEKLNRRVFVD